MGLLDQVLGGLLGGRAQHGGGGMSPVMMALMALLASRGMGGGGMMGGGGGLGGMLGGGGMGGSMGGGMMGGGMGSPMSGGMGGGLGGMLGGGLGGLLQQFQQRGHGDTIDSWVGTGPNRAISPTELHEALGPDTVDHLSQQTGMPQQDLLSELSNLLPDAVDKLTPHGRLPEDHEQAQW